MSTVFCQSSIFSFPIPSFFLFTTHLTRFRSFTKLCKFFDFPQRVICVCRRKPKIYFNLNVWPISPVRSDIETLICLFVVAVKNDGRMNHSWTWQLIVSQVIHDANPSSFIPISLLCFFRFVIASRHNGSFFGFIYIFFQPPQWLISLIS